MGFLSNIPLANELISASQANILQNFSFLGDMTGNASTGYYKLPNGLILQWGNYIVTGGTTSGQPTITFPTPFISACYVVDMFLQISSSNDGGKYSLDKNNPPGLTTFGFRFSGFSALSSSYTFYWIAIGV